MVAFVAQVALLLAATVALAVVSPWLAVAFVAVAAAAAIEMRAS